MMQYIKYYTQLLTAILSYYKVHEAELVNQLKTVVDAIYAPSRFVAC